MLWVIKKFRLKNVVFLLKILLKYAKIIS
jgi:hypothetical protein